jgi:hypothetical protein
MKIYIAGPITIDPDHWREHFADAEEWIHKAYPNAEVVNPLTLENEPECIEAREHIGDGKELWNWMLKRDIRHLMTCTHILMLKGWEKSEGARLELRTAVDVGIIPLIELPEESVLSTYWDNYGKKKEGKPRTVAADFAKFI